MIAVPDPEAILERSATRSDATDISGIRSAPGAPARALEDAGYDTPTPIQEKAIPILLAGPRSDRDRRDRHRQDPGLSAADLPSARIRTVRSAGAGRLPHARAGDPGRGRSRALRRAHGRAHGAGLRRHLERRPEARRWPRAATSSSARRVACSTSSPRPGSRCGACATWCSTRPTECWTWASSTTSTPSCAPRR